MAISLQDSLNSIAAAQRETRSDYHLTLGALIAKLEAISDDLPVVFDFGGAPDELASYRGHYADLAWSCTGLSPYSVSEILEKAKRALGAEFEGYKGGLFEMHDDTPLWCAGYGDNTGCAVIDLHVTPKTVTLLTKQF